MLYARKVTYFHILLNDSQLSNKWATKYPFFVITRGYVTHSIL